MYCTELKNLLRTRLKPGTFSFLLCEIEKIKSTSYDFWRNECVNILESSQIVLGLGLEMLVDFLTSFINSCFYPLIIGKLKSL